MNLKIGNFTSVNRQTDFRRGIILLCSPKSKQIFGRTDLDIPIFRKPFGRKETGVIP
jgi:hypothetical protein